MERFFRSGQQALQQGHFQEAVNDFKKVLALDPSLIEAEVNLGLAYQSLLEYDSAVLHLTKALRARPNLSGPILIVGLDYLKLGLPQKAIPFLQQALQLDRANSTAREALASSALAQDNFRSAADQFKQMASVSSDKPDALFKLGHEYLDLAARLAYRGAHLYPDSAFGHRFLADLLFQRGRWEDAQKEYEKAILSDSQEAGLHTSLGDIGLRTLNWEDAEKQFRLELQLDSKNELAWLGLAKVQLATNRAKAALASVQKVWEISPEFLELQRDFPTIQPSAESIANVRSEPPAPSQHFVLASLCLISNESECADREWKTFQSAVAARGQTATTASAPCSTHQYSQCIASLKAQKALTTSQKLSLGRMYFALQNYELAADSLSQVQGVTKENAEASYWLARTYQALGTDAYARLQESFPDSWRACQMRAESDAFRGKLDDALKEFHAALQVNPKEPALHEALGEFYLKQDVDEATAQTELETALEFDPERTHVLYLLGFLFVEKKDNEKALPYLERALRLQPDSVETNSLLGTTYMRLGKYAEAIPLLQKAALSDHYGNVHYQLYMAYRKLGRTEIAQKERAISQHLRQSYLERDEAIIMGSPQPTPEPQ